MADKTSRDALLDLCTPIEEIRNSMPEYFQKLEELSQKRKVDLEMLRQDLLRRNVPQSRSELQDKQTELKNKQEEERLVLENEISAIEREFSSHGRIYRWFHKGSHESDVRLKRYSSESRFNDMHTKLYSSFTQWESLVDAMSPTNADVFYLFNDGNRDFYVHNPPESLRPWKGVYGYCPEDLPSWLISKWFREPIVPVDKLEDLSGTSCRDGKPWFVFLHGFTVKDVKIFHEPESSGYVHDAEGSDYDWGYHYLSYSPSTNDLLITLEKIDKIPCFVEDNHATERDVYTDVRKWSIDPTKWERFIGKKVEICARPHIKVSYHHWDERIPGESYAELGIYYAGKSKSCDPSNMIRIIE